MCPFGISPNLRRRPGDSVRTIFHEAGADPCRPTHISKEAQGVGADPPWDDVGRGEEGAPCAGGRQFVRVERALTLLAIRDLKSRPKEVFRADSSLVGTSPHLPRQSARADRGLSRLHLRVDQRVPFVRSSGPSRTRSQARSDERAAQQSKCIP
jgi:hypothetical protein